MHDANSMRLSNSLPQSDVYSMRLSNSLLHLTSTACSSQIPFRVLPLCVSPHPSLKNCRFPSKNCLFPFLLCLPGHLIVSVSSVLTGMGARACLCACAPQAS